VYNNRVALSNIPEELHLKVGQLDGEFLDLSVAIPRDRINLSADKAALELKVNCRFEFVSFEAIPHSRVPGYSLQARGLEFDGGRF
jgi:hypothetical protein